MTCNICGLPVLWTFELIQNVGGVGPQKKLVCFPCLTSLGEQLIRDWRRECPTCHQAPTGMSPGAGRDYQSCTNGHLW